MKKIIVLLMVFVMTSALFAGCAKKEEVKEEATTTEAVDAVSTASVVTEAEPLVKALGAEGFWLAATLNDITYDKDIVVEGEFKNDDKIARKLALYTQDADHNITASFTLTAPKLVVKSENFKIQGGTFAGDVYVEANGFQVGKAATVSGNIYFATQEFMDSAVYDETGKVTGSKEVAAATVDVVSTASVVTEADALVKALAADGFWLAATLNDITYDKDIVVEGEFKNDDKIARKLALYTQDADHKITASFTLTAPKLIVKSENFKIQGGTFAGDVYVEANGFQVGKAATVSGNIYFASQEYMDSAVYDETGKVTGVKEVK